MPNLEQIKPQKEYRPHFDNLQKIAQADSDKQLSEIELLLELAKQKYIEGHGTIDLMKQLDSQPSAVQQKLKKIISIVALSDLPDEDIIESLKNHKDKEAILKAVALVKEFKQKIAH
jgi:hypothetical protein